MGNVVQFPSKKTITPWVPPILTEEIGMTRDVVIDRIRTHADTAYMYCNDLCLAYVSGEEYHYAADIADKAHTLYMAISEFEQRVRK